MVNAGLDGANILLFDFNNAGSILSGYLKQIARSNLTFYATPCISASNLGNLTRMVHEYMAIAVGNPAAPKFGDSYVIFYYGSHSIPVDDWKKAIANYTASGYDLYHIGDLFINPNYATFNHTLLEPYLTIFDAVYTFGPVDNRYTYYYQTVLNLTKVYNVPFFGDLTPGYDRETKSGGYSNALGTAYYRRLWERHIAGGFPGVFISSWNDEAERHAIDPSTSWGLTRADLTYWYSRVYKNVPQTWDAPRLYLTTVMQVWKNDSLYVEALVLNPLQKTYKLSVEILNACGRQVFGWSNTTDVAPNDKAIINVIKLLTATEHTFYHAVAWLSDPATGQNVSFVVSAPIVIHTETYLTPDPTLNPRPRDLYYSLSNRHSLTQATGFIPVVQVDLNTWNVSVQIPPTIIVQQVELLHNHRLLHRFFYNQSSYSWRSPAGNTEYLNALINDTSTDGFYVARVTDINSNQAYSEPVLVLDGKIVSMSDSAICTVSPASPCGYSIMNNSQTIVDSYGNVWANSSENITVNGIAQSSFSNVSQIVYVNSQIWIKENTEGWLYYENSNSSWVQTSNTNPLNDCSLPTPSPSPFPTSSSSPSSSSSPTSSSTPPPVSMGSRITCAHAIFFVVILSSL